MSSNVDAVKVVYKLIGQVMRIFYDPLYVITMEFLCNNSDKKKYEWRSSEIADALGLPNAKLLKVLNNLRAEGFLERMDSSKKIKRNGQSHTLRDNFYYLDVYKLLNVIKVKMLMLYEDIELVTQSSGSINYGCFDGCGQLFTEFDLAFSQNCKYCGGELTPEKLYTWTNEEKEVALKQIHGIMEEIKKTNKFVVANHQRFMLKSIMTYNSYLQSERDAEEEIQRRNNSESYQETQYQKSLRKQSQTMNGTKQKQPVIRRKKMEDNGFLKTSNETIAEEDEDSNGGGYNNDTTQMEDDMDEDEYEEDEYSNGGGYNNDTSQMEDDMDDDDDSDDY